MKHPDTVLDCLPHLRLFAHTMCSDPETADEAVAECLERAQKRLCDTPSPDRLFLALLTDLAAGIRRFDRTRASGDEENMQGVMHTLRRLPPHHRDVLIVIALFRLRYRDAADVCCCPIGTIKSRFSRAKATFTAALEAGSPRKVICRRSSPSRAGLHEASNGRSRICLPIVTDASVMPNLK